MNISTKKTDNTFIIFLDGVFDCFTLSSLAEIINQFDEKLPEICYIDFEKLQHIDSLAIGFLIKTFTKFRKYGKELIITNLNEKVLNIFKLTKINKFLKIYENFNYDNL